MTQTRTPGPWKVRPFSVSKFEDHLMMVYEVQGGDLRQRYNTCDDTGEIEKLREENKANAVFIARACNAYEELVAALRKAKAALYNVPEVGKKYDQQHSHTHSQACLDIDVAIAKAEGR